MLAIVNMTLLLNIYVFLDISNLFYPRIIPYFACFYLPLHSQIPLFRRDNAFCLTFLLQFFQNQFICLIYHGIVQGSEINLRSISESCPMPSLITDRGMFWLLAILAHEWRVTYMVRFICKLTIAEISFNLLLTRTLHVPVLRPFPAGGFNYWQQVTRFICRVFVKKSPAYTFPT